MEEVPIIWANAPKPMTQDIYEERKACVHEVEAIFDES